jgi:hypothetical protein
VRLLLAKLAVVVILLWSLPAAAIDIVIGTTGIVGKANELATNGTNCSSGFASQGIDTFGNAEGCFLPGGGKTLTTAGPGSPIAGPDAATVDQVHITDLTTSPTVFNAPTNPANGARLTYSIYCQTAARALTWNAVFSSEAGPTLPTSCVVGQYLILTYRFNSLSNKWALEDNSRGQSAAAVLLTETAGVITPINCDTTRWGYLTLTVDATVSNPVCTPQHGQRITYSIQTSAPKLLTWGNQYSSVYTLTLPTRTTGNGMKDEFGFIYDAVNTKWDMDASTQPNRGTGTIRLSVLSAHQPATNPGIIDRAENNDRLLFDATTSECVWWNFRMPTDYVGNLTAKIPYSMVSATTGGVSVDTFVMAVSPGDAADVNTDSYAAVNNCDDTPVPGTAGFLKEITCVQTNTDGLAAGDIVRWKLCRATADTVDTATGDMEVINEIHLEYSR